MPSNLGAAVYGMITVEALLAAESPRQETYLKTIGAVLIALVMVWLAHAYTEYVSWRLKENKGIAVVDLARVLGQDVAILEGAAIPLLALLIAWAVGRSLSTAVTAAIWASAATIVALELIAGIRAKQSGAALVLQVSIGILLGVLIVVLRAILH
jgi:hypothetical protein